nr:Sir2 family NAD-dependent protein deacetylase [uncultured Helicobacter sp.]
MLERAGAQNVIHLHGELSKIICPHCEHILDIGYKVFTPRACKHCGYEQLKPFVVFFGERAPKYMQMYKIFEGLSFKDYMVVIGTSGIVVDISSIIGRCEWKCKMGLKILNNLEPSSHIAESVFDNIYYKPATQAIWEIKTDLLQFFHR